MKQKKHVMEDMKPPLTSNAPLSEDASNGPETLLASPESPVAPPGERSTEMPANSRGDRIRDLLASSLAKLDPLEANLGVVNSDLMLLAYRLKQSIDSALTEPDASEELEMLMPAVENYLKVVKQIERFSKLDLQLRSRQTTGATSLVPGRIAQGEEIAN